MMTFPSEWENKTCSKMFQTTNPEIEPTFNFSGCTMLRCLYSARFFERLIQIAWFQQSIRIHQVQVDKGLPTWGNESVAGKKKRGELD